MATTNGVVQLMLFSLIMIPSSLSLPSGAPQQACPDLTPRSVHEPPQNTPVPYNLTVSGLVESMPIYIPGQMYTVTLGISDPSAGTPLFRGFLIQLRSAADNSILGGISVITSGGNVQLHACAPSNGGVTHTNNLEKSSISFQWTPTPGTGSVLFRYTVVQAIDVSWVGVDSPLLQEAITEPPPPGPTGSTLRLSPEGPNFSIEQSRTFVLECISEDQPTPMLSWIFLGNNTVVSTESGTSSISLRFLSISATDAGLYVCTATPQSGVSTNITANISVIAANISEPAVEVNLRVSLNVMDETTENFFVPLASLIITTIPQSAPGVQIASCFLPNGCIDAIAGTNVSRLQCNVRSYPAINEASNPSLNELRALVQTSGTLIVQMVQAGIFRTNFTIDDPNARPRAVVTIESGDKKTEEKSEVTNDVLMIEPRRRRVVRCSPDQASSQLVQNGSPVVGAWLETEPGAIIDQMAIIAFANSITNRFPCSSTQVPRRKRVIPLVVSEVFPNTIEVFGGEVDTNRTCVVVGEFGFNSRTVTVSTISINGGPSMSAIYRFFASLPEPPTPGGLPLRRRQTGGSSALLSTTSGQILDLIPESDPGIQIIDCIENQQANMNMPGTALECNFTSFDTTEAQFIQNIGIITTALTNGSLPSVNITAGTVEGFCPIETTSSEGFGSYNWPLTGGNQTAELPCTFGGGYAVRQCLPGLIWAPANVSQCRDGLLFIVTVVSMPSLPSPVLNPGSNILVDEGRPVLISCSASIRAGLSIGRDDNVAWYRIFSNGSEELVPPRETFYSNFVDVNNPNNTDPSNLANSSVIKALRPGVSLDSATRLYSSSGGLTATLLSQTLFKTSSSIGGQYACRATNSNGARNFIFNITVARAMGEFSPVYIRATTQFPSQFQGDLFFDNVEFMLLQLINASSLGIETVFCSPATPRIGNLVAPQVEVECVVREYPPLPGGILFVGTAILNITVGLGVVVPDSRRVSVVGFCNAETIDGGPRGLFRWNETEVGTSASARCVFGPANALVTRTCLSPNNLSPALIGICRTEATVQITEIQNVNITEENVVTVLNNLTSVVAGTNETVDQNPDTIRVVQTIIARAAALIQSPTIPQPAVVDIVNSTTMLLENIQDWPENVLQEESNRIVESFDNITGTLIQQENFTNISINTMNILLIAERVSRELFQGRTFSVRDIQGNITEIDNTMDALASILIPRNILPQGRDVTIAFVFYRETSLFPITNTPSPSPPANTVIDRTVVGTSIIGAQVDGIIDGIMLNTTIQINFTLNAAGTPGENETATPSCVFYNFTNGGFWSSRGCSLVNFNEMTNEIICECNHLTNFACLVDISARTTIQEALPPSYRLALEIMSYVGVILSLLGLITLLITYLVFKKLRQKDVTKFHVQLALSMILMLIVFVAGINRTENRPGCITVGVLLHYLILVTWMWMAAEAVLLFQKLVIVFVKVSLKYIVVLSIICWAAPIVPVVIPVAVNPDYYITLPQNQTGAPGFCFINHIGVFFGAFLGPIFLIILFNLVIFIIVITVLVRHNISRNKRQMKDSKIAIPPKETCKLILSLSGIMTLLGLTWVLSVFTSIGASTNRDASFALQFLFVFFNSLQGFFLFIFFVILSSDARNSWIAVLCPCIKSSEPHTSKSHLRYTGNTSSTGKTNTYSGNIYATTGTLEAAVRKEDLKMHSVAPIYEDDEDDVDLPPLAPIDEKADEKIIEEKPKMEQSSVVGKELRARVKRVSTKKRTHHVETAELDFMDDFSDDDEFP